MICDCQFPIAVLEIHEFAALNRQLPGCQGTLNGQLKIGNPPFTLGASDA
jgi:hypothetical protein